MADEQQVAVVPPRSTTRWDRADSISFAITTLLAFSAYLYTLAPNVTLEFSGLYATGALYAGVPHPPGYPVWTIYGWLFAQWLPVSNVAWRVAVSSATAAAVACGLVATIVTQGGKLVLGDSSRFTALTQTEQGLLRGVCGCSAGLVLAFSNSVWGKAVIVDVWALSLLLFVGLLWLLLRWMFEPDKRHRLYSAFLLFGLLLTSNQEMIIALPGLVLAVMLGSPPLGRDVALGVTPLAAMLTARNHVSLWISYPDQGNPLLWLAFGLVIVAGIGLAIQERCVGSEWKTAALCGLLLLLGFGLCFFAPIASMSNPPVNWAYPRTVEGAFHLIGRGQYERVQPLLEWGESSAQFSIFVWYLVTDFGWVYSVLGVLPFVGIRRLNRMGRRWLLGLLAVFLFVGPTMLLELDPSLDSGSLPMLRPYFAAPHCLLAIWLGLGMQLVGTVVAARSTAEDRGGAQACRA